MTQPATTSHGRARASGHTVGIPTQPEPRQRMHPPHARFAARRDLAAVLGFDAVFQPMWEFHLAYPVAGFRSGYLDVPQLLLTEGTHR